MQGLIRFLFLWVMTIAIFAESANAQVNLPNAKPVPRMQVIPLPMGQASVRRDGAEISRYWFSPQLNRPFLFPIIGPSGRSLTRMGHPHDATGHSHHNSLWISHNDVGGVVFWGDRGKGRIVHRRVFAYEDQQQQASIEVQNAWQDEAGRVLLDERRRMTFIDQGPGQWLLVIDLQLCRLNDPIVLGKTPFGMIGVRMAKTIGVHDGGGTIRNSTGARDEKEVFWKRARWVDYWGPITPTKIEGITLMDHPSNPNHPSHFHVRNDGWMGASLTFEKEISLKPKQPLILRYGLWIHSGVPVAEKIDEAFAYFVKIPPFSAANSAK